MLGVWFIGFGISQHKTKMAHVNHNLLIHPCKARKYYKAINILNKYLKQMHWYLKHWWNCSGEPHKEYLYRLSFLGSELSTKMKWLVQSHTGSVWPGVGAEYSYEATSLSLPL